MTFYIVDVFCTEKFSGNQLAVVICPEQITDTMLQTIAREFNFSETTFIFPGSRRDDSWPVRIFTPHSEVPFAGHPTLGTAWVIRNEMEKNKAATIVLDLKVGKIPVHFDDASGLQWMKQIEPRFGRVHPAAVFASILGLQEGSLDTRFPVRSVSTGIEFIMIPLKNLRAVQSASMNIGEYRDYFAGRQPDPLFIFCPETYEKENTINCRMFADEFGIPEDPATGSANGCLAAYLTEYEYFEKRSVDVRVEQGYEIGRKSILHIRTRPQGEHYNIEVGGGVIKIAGGEMEPLRGGPE